MPKIRGLSYLDTGCCCAGFPQSPEIVILRERSDRKDPENYWIFTSFTFGELLKMTRMRKPCVAVPDNSGLRN